VIVLTCARASVVSCLLCGTMRALFLCLFCVSHFFFFFQAEDGIRDWSVTGVQTCALPICHRALPVAHVAGLRRAGGTDTSGAPRPAPPGTGWPARGSPASIAHRRAR